MSKVIHVNMSKVIQVRDLRFVKRVPPLETLLFCYNITLKKNNVLFSRCLDFFIFVKFINLKICNVIIDITPHLTSTL